MEKNNRQNINSYIIEDEGIAIDIMLDSFSQQCIPIIYLESFESDNKMQNNIDFIKSHQVELHHIINNEITAYITQVYKQDGGKVLSQISLIKIYLLPEKDEYGFMFAWSGDSEHGIGVKLKNLSMIKIGYAETAFL
ncbi:hypothetical protein A9G24_08960 [Gilliamella sp. App6-5]|uniref:hypothetical protein n=1 Tax=Gilliamella sp. App6-5 TaxID=3120232 RepID=UPI00080DDB0A|nr:hypothetical protein [Gilliamella apicola]OCG12242.1 hypothetical protein A9G24_08960 [Gilliamella apicola]